MSIKYYLNKILAELCFINGMMRAFTSERKKIVKDRDEFFDKDSDSIKTQK